MDVSSPLRLMVIVWEITSPGTTSLSKIAPPNDRLEAIVDIAKSEQNHVIANFNLI
jgi:hypothetical protein